MVLKLLWNFHQMFLVILIMRIILGGFLGRLLGPLIKSGYMQMQLCITKCLDLLQ